MQNIVLILITALVLPGCYKDSFSEEELIELTKPERVFLNTIEGTVLDTLGFPIIGARVLSDESEIFTDENGYFELDLAIPQTGIFLEASHDFYYEGGIRIYANAPLRQRVQINLVPKGSTHNFINQAGTIINLSNFGQVSVPANAFQSGQNPYTGMVHLEVYQVNPVPYDNLNKRLQVFESIEKSNATQILKSDFQSMLFIKAYDDNGRELAVAPNKRVQVKFPTYGMIQNESIELFSFDNTSGFWITESQVTDVNANFITAELSHFSWWGVGFQKSSKTVCLNFEKPVPGNRDQFVVTAANGAVTYFGSVDYANDVCFPIPEGEDLEVQVFNSCMMEVGQVQLPSSLANNSRVLVQVESFEVPGLRVNVLVLDCDGTSLDEEVTVYISTGSGIDSLGQFLNGFTIELEPCFTDGQLSVLIVHSQGNTEYTYSSVLDITRNQTEYQLEIIACQDVMPEDGYLVINGITFMNAEARSNPEETLILADLGNEKVLIGIDGFEVGTFNGRVINFQQNQFCTGLIEITSYSDIGGFVEGNFHFPPNEGLACEEIIGEFKAKRTR